MINTLVFLPLVKCHSCLDVNTEDELMFLTHTRDECDRVYM